MQTFFTAIKHQKRRRLEAVPALVWFSLLIAWPVWGHGGEPISTTLWTAVGLGAVMLLAYGVSWGAVRPLMRRGDEAMLAERAQRENAVLRRSLDLATEPTALLDPQGRVDLVNAAWRTLVDPDVLSGRPLDLGDAERWRIALVELADGAVSSQVQGAGRLWRVEAAGGAGYCVRSVEKPMVMHAGPLELDRLRGEALCRGQRLDLTVTEFKLLVSLVERDGRAVAREELLREVWGHQGPVRSRTVDTHIRRLRDKLGTDRACIATVRGQGYCLELGS